MSQLLLGELRVERTKLEKSYWCLVVRDKIQRVTPWKIRRKLLYQPLLPRPLPSFHWDEIAGQMFCEDIEQAHEEETLWHKNIISLPLGHAGVEYIKEHMCLT